ncbi:MAG: Amidohydrolase, partial [Chloroflexi bacterium]|nr:Amidohydrolase [Chloroflexota bacterium]
GAEGGGVFNCPALMDGWPEENANPQRWDEVPRRAYDPIERLEALDSDGVDAEVLFPNNPGASFFQSGDPEFELDCVRAYNDAAGEWRAISDRYAPLVMLPFLSEPRVITAEIERAVKMGHRGVNTLAEPSSLSALLPHFSDRHWYPIWEACEQMGIPVHIHASAGMGQVVGVPRWAGFTPHQHHSAFTIPCGAWPAQLIPNLIFSGIADRFPRLQWVFAETGIGSVNYVVAACDHEWEARHLWTEGLATRPSEIVHRQMHVNFWYEVAGIAERGRIGVENIMWESDFPHVASTYPRSRAFVEHCLEGVQEPDRSKMLYENAMRLYKL